LLTGAKTGRVWGGFMSTGSQRLRALAAPFVSAVLAVLLLVPAWGGSALAQSTGRAPAVEQSKNLAPGFSTLPKGARVVVMPTDIELFLISAGGVAEPKADWTEAATKHFKAALYEKKKSFGTVAVDLSEKDADEFAEVNTLHAAVAGAITAHHFGPGFLNLPTKDGKLDWSLGDSVRRLKEKSGADYALFSWIRDSYASGERIAATVLLALVGVGMAPGGLQQGYASLVDLSTGRIVWFNRLFRGSGDLREADKAAEVLNVLLQDFPAPK
jgi:hypothetical protein